MTLLLTFCAGMVVGALSLFVLGCVLAKDASTYAPEDQRRYYRDLYRSITRTKTPPDSN